MFCDCSAGATQIIGNQLFNPLTEKIKPDAAAGPRDHFNNTKIASASSPGGRISWMELQPKRDGLIL